VYLGVETVIDTLLIFGDGRVVADTTHYLPLKINDEIYWIRLIKENVK
ncbi:hypothetical protein LCGC14_2121670, partial [marine sediment metagenome]